MAQMHCMENAKLLFPTFDARLPVLKISPKCADTTIRYKLRLYDEEKQQTVLKSISFEGVLAIEFRMNYFDNPIGAEVSGFYECFSREEKAALLERNFTGRKEAFLLPGDYDYNPGEDADILNNRESLNAALAELDCYHLYHQQTTGGVYAILAREWHIK